MYKPETESVNFLRTMKYILQGKYSKRQTLVAISSWWN